MKKELPYVFDLLWDIKTEEYLKAEYIRKKSDLIDMEDCMRHYPNLMFKEWWREHNSADLDN
jgi:hypothetical protein